MSGPFPRKPGLRTQKMNGSLMNPEIISRELPIEWDPGSKIWILISKFETEYDISEKPTYTSNYHYNKYDNSWNELRIESNYDASGNFLSAKWYYRDNTMDGWQLGKVIDCSYDQFQNLILRESYYLDINSNWIGLEKIEWSYDVENNQIEEINYLWDSFFNDWVPKTKDEFIRDEFGNEITVVYQWKSAANNWIKENKYENFYDSSDNLTSIIDYEWDSISQNWIENWREELGYDNNGREILVINYDWDSLANDWIQRWKLEQTYGNTRLYAEYSWDKNQNEWIGIWKRETFFNEYEDWTFEADYKWDSLTNNWDLNWKIRCDRIYNNSGYLLIESNLEWETDISDWILTNRKYYYYRNGEITGIPDQSANLISLFPNPTDSYLYISGLNHVTQIKIYTVCGNLVFQKNVLKEPLFIASLPQGVYILIFYEDGLPFLKTRFIKR